MTVFTKEQIASLGLKDEKMGPLITIVLPDISEPDIFELVFGEDKQEANPKA